MAVVSGSVSAYSSYDTSSTRSSARCARTRTFAVSCADHRRAKASKPASRWRMLSRSSCAGRLKSYAGYWSAAYSRTDPAVGAAATAVSSTVMVTGLSFRCGSLDDGGG